MLLGLVALHAAAGTAVLAGARRLGRRGFLIGGLAPAVTLVSVAAHAEAVLDGGDITERWSWVPGLGLDLDVRLDAFALLMVIVVSGIGSLVFAYAWHYFGTSPNSGRAAGLLTLFAGSMLGVVLADNLLLLYVFWELTSITSYLLIGIDNDNPEARSAALHALLVTGLGGLAMLGGFVVLGRDAGTFRMSELLAMPPPAGAATSVALVLVLVGAFAKSAQYPFHSWLPDAMVAPTPISAYLHSAAMVKAGVYLVARFAPTFADVGVWRPLVVSVGLVTMFAGGLRALRPFDLKRLLAFGTISQLGFLMVLFGVGRPEATAAGTALLLAHALFKAALFMVVGIVDHEAHTRDIRELPILASGWTPARLVAVISAASMAAIPPLAGFIAKEEAYGAFVEGSAADRVVLAGIVAGSVLTVAYSLRLAAALVRPDVVSGPVEERPVSEHGPRFSFVLPGAVLTAASVLLGVAPALWSRLVDRAANSLDPSSHAHLELWHGITTPLVLSALTLGAGAALFAARRRVEAVQARLAPKVTGTDVFDGVVHAVLRLAARTTSIMQSGSLPIYVLIVLATAAIAPTWAMLSGDWWPGTPDIVGRPSDVPIAALLTAGALAATLAVRRFAAAILLGVVGYGMAVLFVVHGAPDLALTQFTVETLSVVVFLLVFTRLPDRFKRRTAPAVGRAVRLAVAAAVGVFVVLLGVAAAGSRTEPPVSRDMPELALSEGDGRNVVNVILVDIRGMDTLGEITVLVTAGIGITALARAGRRPRPRPPRRWERRGREKADA